MLIINVLLLGSSGWLIVSVLSVVFSFVF